MDQDQLNDRIARRADPSAWSARSRWGVVTSAHHQATAAGLQVLERGGNAFDAAIATSSTLAVVESAGSGIGGMAIAVIYTVDDRAVRVLSGACRAPELATPAQVRAAHRYQGHRAVAVPGHPAVLEELERSYGSLPRHVTLRRAIELARDGFRLSPLQAKLLQDYEKAVRGSPAAEVFMCADGSPPRSGMGLVQPELANTLERLRDAGFRDFYAGDIAAAIAEDMRRHDGFVTARDLADVKGPDLATPISTPWGQRRLYTAATPAGGRSLLEMLNLAAQLAPEGIDCNRPEGALMVAEIIRRARADRRKYRLEASDEPDLASEAYAESIAPQLRAKLGIGETSHISIVDAKGNAVAMTQSIERSFGSKVMAPSLGFLYNGYMKGFKIEAQDHPHFLRPGARARSNAAPAIVLDESGVQTVIGSTGSERMLSSIFTTLLRLERESAFAAVHGPRLHASPERKLLIEAEGFSAACRERLAAGGFELEPVDRYSFRMGGLQLVNRGDDGYEGVADPRRDGWAAGPEASPF